MRAGALLAWVVPLIVSTRGQDVEVEAEQTHEDAGASYTAPDISGFVWADSFQGGDPFISGGWVKSEDPKYASQAVSIKSFGLEGMEEDLSLLLEEPMKHYGLGAPLPAVFSNKDKDLVVQYEVLLANGFNCGGAYVKVLRAEGDGTAVSDLAGLTDSTPYAVMFGPDKCGATNKVHFIFQHQNPVTGEWEEKHLKTPPKVKSDKNFHVYTLHIKPDNGYEIYVDTESVSKGSLLEDFEPPVNPPAEIDDPDDVKPDDWVDDAKIPDPDATKPDDWDEDAPQFVVDDEAEKPEGWLDEEPLHMPDPEASQPEDWDDEEDGEWEPPLVANPKCDEAPGCGEWEPPTKPNPAYKGKWVAPMIANPAYKGEWAPTKIQNPAFFEDKQPSNMPPIGGLAVEIWTTDGGIWMDNFLIGDSISDALRLAEETWRPKHDAEKARKEKEAKSAKASRKKGTGADMDKLRQLATEGKIRELAEALLATAGDMAADSPMAAVATIVVATLGVILLFGRRGRRRARARPREGQPAAGGAAGAGAGPGNDGEGEEEEVEVEDKEEEEEEEEEEEGEEGDEPAPEVKARGSKKRG